MTPVALTRFTTVTPLGRGLAATCRALQEGRSGLRRFEGLDGVVLDAFVGRVEGLEEAPVRPDLTAFDCRNNRLAQLTLTTDGFADAVADAVGRYGAGRVAVVAGTSTSGIREGERAFAGRGPDGALPPAFRFAETQDLFALATFVRRFLGIGGPVYTVSTACASSAKVVVDACQFLAAGLADAVVAGGADSLCLMTLRGFGSLGLLSPEPCRPNDAARAGISIGEGAGFALVERAEAAPGDAVRLLGYGESSDAHHMSTPHPEGEGARRAMLAALARAGLAPEAIDYINLHGTGSDINDQVEDRAVAGVFGAVVPCSSTKGWTGHLLGAAGIVEAVIACLCLRHGFLPGNINLRTVDPGFRSQVLTASRRQEVRRVLSNSFGFGGSNCCLILGTA